MNKELENFARQSRALIAEARGLVDRHKPEDLVKTPAGGGWSVADNLAHLAQTVRLYLPKIDAAIEANRSVRGDGPYRYNLLGRFFLWVLEPPVRLRVKAPPVFQPAQGMSGAQALEDFAARYEELIERMQAADGLDLARIKVVSPASDSMRIPLGVAFGSMTAHARRHLWQARNVLSRS